MEENKLKNARYIDVKAIIHLLKVQILFMTFLAKIKERLMDFS